MELLVVIALLGVLLAIGVPNFLSATYPHMKLKRTARDVYTTLQYARGKAVGMTHEYGVQFNLSANPKTFKVVTRATKSSPWVQDATYAERSAEVGVDIFSVTVSSTTYTSGTTAVIAFEPVGTATTAVIRLNAVANPADKYRVEVSSTSGRSEIITGW